ncbi:Ferric reductase-like transmembrane component [Cordyceps militaris CM01]|uniref:Ferric reductase-like transmembrane component n=2 Tax=Cordyceps militaris TaxID=73501 RepID=G3JRA0_CORMM|nr:Ferric reductase-like transmembrane component [Cordyceps militaris CM01]ATY65523.1 Ferric reductase-like transmembrane component [Cordyceps militaris]EGX88396.1 Ferric reductase-like transmembrane component [Cordyceps militaris CM01]
MSGYPPALIKKFAIRHEDNVKAMEGFTFATLAIGGVFVLLHLSKSAYHVFRRWQGGSRGSALLSSPMRMIRQCSIYSVPFFPSAGHALIIVTYIALNFVFLFAFLDNNNFGFITNIASRTGWLALANMIFSVFLALKNTPLAFLTAWSYERLNILHRYSGMFAVLHMIIHAITYSAYFAGQGQPEMLTMKSSIYGILAGASFFLLGVSGVVLRPWWYELFYYVHIVFFALAIIMTGLHQPSFVDGFLIITVLTGSMWVLDRLIRFVRLVSYSFNNHVTLTPLPHGGTRVTLAKAPLGALSGKHCFLWIPAIRSFETHPFTISAMNPLEFVVTAHNGFTKDLHNLAVEQPGVEFGASVEGSYGTFPKPSSFDHVVLIAGGTGASFTFGAAFNALKHLNGRQKTKIMFVWTVRHRSILSWYASHLQTLCNDSRVSVHVFVTKDRDPSGLSMPNSAARHHIFPRTHENSRLDMSSASSMSGDAEKNIGGVVNEDVEIFSGIPITWKRPDVPGMIRGVVSGAAREESVLVMGCGPGKLMKQVRNTTAACIWSDGPTVELHCEEFGW